VLGVLRVPLYQAGRVSSRVREAKQIASQRRIQIIEAGRAVRESVVRTWNIYISSADTIESLEAQVAANELALEGVNQEALVGTRTTLDVLDAEQELVLSQVNLINARRNRVVAAYQLIATTGSADRPQPGACGGVLRPRRPLPAHPRPLLRRDHRYRRRLQKRIIIRRWRLPERSILRQAGAPVQVIRAGGVRGVTGKTQAARQPSIDDLLASIRQAIHERVEPDAPARSHSALSAKPVADQRSASRRAPRQAARSAPS
jgi:hypothetical protein